MSTTTHIVVVLACLLPLVPGMLMLPEQRRRFRAYLNAVKDAPHSDRTDHFRTEYRRWNRMMNWVVTIGILLTCLFGSIVESI